MPALDPQSLTRHLDRLYRAAWALCGSPHDAEDLVQETFARVLSKPRSVHAGRELQYLLQALRNTYFSSRRSAARRPAASVDVQELPLADPRSDGNPVAALQARELFATIAALPEDFRLALIAVDVAGLSYAEAAELLDAREQTIATRLFRARARIAQALAGEDGASPPTAPPHTTADPDVSADPAASADSVASADPAASADSVASADPAAIAERRVREGQRPLRRLIEQRQR